MATVYTNGRSATNKAPISPLPGGGIAVDIREYDAAALEAASTINVATVPAGCTARIAQFSREALGASSTVAAGDADDTDRFITATDTSTAGVAVQNAGFWRYYATETDLLLTTAGAAITGRIQAVVEVKKGNHASEQ